MAKTQGKTQVHTPLSIPELLRVEVNDFPYEPAMKTWQKKDSIIMVVDYFSKMTHFIICYKIVGTSHIVNLYFKEKVHLYGVPITITSNRMMKFLNRFWYQD